MLAQSALMRWTTTLLGTWCNDAATGASGLCTCGMYLMTVMKTYRSSTVVSQSMLTR